MITICRDESFPESLKFNFKKNITDVHLLWRHRLYEGYKRCWAEKNIKVCHSCMYYCTILNWITSIYWKTEILKTLARVTLSSILSSSMQFKQGCHSQKYNHFLSTHFKRTTHSNATHFYTRKKHTVPTEKIKIFLLHPFSVYCRIANELAHMA